MRTEMDRNRDVRRTTIAATNGLSRRRHRTNSLRDSPEEDGVFELQESGRLRDRKKDRDRERDRDRDRLIHKRRRGDRLMHGNSNREDGGDDSSEEGVNDEEEDEDEDVGGDIVGGGSGSMRMLLPNPPSMCSSSSLLNQRRSFPPATKSFSAAPTWKADEMIGVSVPRKARSASTKRSHEWASCPGIIGDSNYRQASTSPVRPSPTTVVASSSSPAPVSPSGSNISMKKKLKHSRSKFRPPKTTSSKSSSSAQDEIEIEIAEVLYGMMRQPQGSTKQENLATDSIKFEAREVNKSTSDAKSRVSSPISSSQSTIHLSSITLPQNSSSSVAPMSIVAPKRKRPRPLKYDDESPSVLTHQNSPISATSKVGADQSSKTETCSPIMDKDPGSAVENGGVSYGLGKSHAVSLPVSTTAQPQPESIESSVVSEPKTVTQKTKNENMGTSMEEPQSPKKELVLTRLDDTKENSRSSEAENQREDMFKIDLMAPPQRSSPERNSEVDNVAVDSKPTVTDTETDKEPMINEESKIGKNLKQEAANVEPEKANAMVEENELKMSSIGQETNIDLEKPDNRESVHARVSGNNSNKLQQHVAKQPLQPPTNPEKSAQSNSLPLSTSMAAWPGGLPPLGYMAPLQGPVSIDGSTVASAAIQPPTYLFSQPRAKRCATHCYIARNICYHQQILKSNSFWPAAAAGSAPLYGATHLPSTEFHANISGRGVNSGPDKGQGPAIFSGLLGMDKGAQAANIVDAAQRKQLLLQQTLPPGAPSNILHGPAFIFPFGQQQAAAAAACVRPGSVKSPTPGCVSSSTTPKAMSTTAPAMSFNYPNVHGNETQYLVLQNNAYPFPIPSHVGAPPAYRGPHAPAIPFFNGSFYSSQMLHPSQMQQQQQPSHSQQSQQGHQNTSISSGSTSSQKHLQNHQLRPHASGINGGTGSLQAFSSPKNQSTQPMQVHSRQQQQQNQHAPHQARQLESEMGSKDIPSIDDGRATCGAMSIYGHNFAMPMHAPNFLMTPASFSGTGSTSVASGNNNSQKQQLQQHGSKGLVETSQAFGMSFASNNGSTTTTAGFDVASIAHHPAILQSIADVRQGYHFMAAAAQAAHQKKTFNVPEEKNGGDCSNGGEEGKNMAGKEFAVRQSIAFARPDLTDAMGSTISGKTVIDSSSRSLKLVSTSACASDSVIPATLSGVNASSAQQQQQQMQQNHQHQQHQMQQNHQHQQQQMQQNHQQQQQMQRYQQQQIIQQQLAAAARTKTPTTSNGSVYPDHLPPTSMAAKFPNAISSFSQNLLQGNSSPVQSPQWKNSPRTNHSSQTPSSMASSTSSSLKSLPQQGRPQQGYTQISFAANPKPSTQGQGVLPASSNQSPSPVMVGSPTTSSVSKSTGGSPRTTTTSTSTVNKTCQASMLSSQQAKNSSASSLKSSPGGSNVSSIPGNPHITSSMSILGKSQQQQQISKQSIQQTQLYFSSTAPVPNSNNTTSAAATSAYYHQRRWSGQQQQSQSSSSGISNTSDPAKAAAAAMKAGGLHSQTIIHPAQFAAAGQSGSTHQLMPYVHAVPTAVQVKPAEQKQPAGE